MKQLNAAIVGACITMSGPVLAQSSNMVVVELYTSQGCSSCPAADEILGNLISDDRIIPLSMHVDYWDYLGWKDKFANPKFTARQRDYARVAHDNTIYTPQMVVDGQTRIVGSRRAEVDDAIATQLAKPNPVMLQLVRNGGKVAISAQSDPPSDRPMRVQLVRYSPAEQVAIKRGENKGQTITYHNVVTSWQRIGEWNGASPLSMEANAPGSDGVVVIIQADGPAEILAAAQLR